MFVYLLVAALLAGWGLHDLIGSPDRRRLRSALVVLAVVAAVPVVWVVLRVPIDGDVGRALSIGWGFEDMPVPQLGDNILLPELGQQYIPLMRLTALLAWGVLAAAALALIALRLRGAGPHTVAALAVLLVVVDLWRAGMGWNPAVDVDEARQPETPALRELQADAPARFAGIFPTTGNPPVTPNTAMDFGLYDPAGYDYPVEDRFQSFWQRYAAANAPLRPITSVTTAHEPALRALSLLGVSRLVQDPEDPLLEERGLTLTYNRPDARIYTNRRALPRAWVVGAQRVVTGDEATLRAVGDPDFDPRRTAIVESSVSGLGAGSGGEAQIVSYEPERVQIEATSRGPGLLVLSDLHYPGWKAEVDGREVDIERVDYLLRGVPLEDGEHTVEFRYEPVSWRVGWILSLAGLAALAAADHRGRPAREAHVKRPVAFAALVYALLALTFVSPALMPGKVLSNSDSFWFQPPWVDRQARRLRAAGEPRDRRHPVADALVPPVHGRAAAGHSPVEPAHHERAAVPRPTPSRRSSRRTACRATRSRSTTRSRWWPR